jgi:epoxyqueuosine reductase
MMDLKKDIRALASEAGFDQVGFTTPSHVDHAAARLHFFLDQGRHGTMDWMETHADRRSHPTNLWPEVRSVIVLGKNYGPDIDPLDNLARKDRGTISVYAQGKDYHDLIKKRLKRIARAIHSETGAEVKVFVDTAPVMEKPLAQAAGLGWQGKHTNLVSGELGSWLFLGSIFTTLEIEPDSPHAEQCGSCHKCLDICPTAAFPKPFELDARRCISYLTIELKTHIPLEFRRPMGNRIYGCDDCLAVCPWNKFASRTDEIALHPREALAGPLLRELAELDDAAFRVFFAGSPVKRTGRDRFVRNVLIAIGNSGDASFVPTLKSLLGDPSALVRAMAIWALSELLGLQDFQGLKKIYCSDESDADVLAEWARI